VVIREIGVVYLSGMTLGEARIELQDLFEKFYPDIRIHVTVGQLRTLRVYVVGEVVQPGAYTVSSLSTVLTALYYAGGPAEYGSLRQVRLIRNNETLGEVDLYQYLLRGDRTHDLRLENDDTIFVPPVGPRVTLRGELRRPAIYEFLPDERLDDLIEIAGGVLATGYLKRIQIDRILKNEEHVILDVDYVSSEFPGGAPDVELFDGDEVFVFPVLPGYENAVWIRGAVRRPGRYELKPGMTLLDLVSRAEGLEGEAYLPRVQIERRGANEQVQFLTPDLGGILRGAEPDVALSPKDSVRVYSIWEMRDRDEVEIYGEIRRPGRYFMGTGMTLRDLVFRAGGLRESAYLMRAEISRIRRQTEGDERTSDVIHVRLADVIAEGSEESSRHLLQTGDKVFIRRIPQWDSLHTVEITGEVRFPGTYALTSTKETLAELFERSGGVEQEAFLEAAVFEREGEGRVVVDFPKVVLQGSERDNLILEDGDRIHVPRIPETVRVTGAVFQPSSHKFVSGKGAEYYVKKCGGFLERADRGRVRITRSNGAVVAPRRFWPDPNVERGNVIVVPFKEESEEIDWAKMADVAQTIAQLAMTVYLLDQAFNN
jgi:protein involved in polysaccharide export with SLBB domain